MKTIIFICLSLFCLSTNASDWDLFPINQKSNCFTPRAFYTTNSVELHVFDSVHTRTNETIHYAKYNLDLQGAGTCYRDTVQSLYWLRNGFMHVDSLTYRQDTVFYFSQLSTLPFYFLPLASIGQSWIVSSDYQSNDYNQITITCSAIQVENFLGVSDSVKLFTLAANGVSSGQVPVSNFVIRLSKNFGFVEFVPFPFFLYHPPGMDFYSLELIGMTDTSGGKYGYQQPEFSDYFDLSVGDILAWEFHHDGWNVFDWTEYYKDSITHVVITPASVIYTYDRLVQDTDFVFTQYYNLTNKFFKSEFINIIESPPQWLGFGNNQFGNAFSNNQVLIWKTGELTLEFDSLSGDTITQFVFDSEATSVDTSDCRVLWTTDLGYSFKISSRDGIIESCHYNFTTDCTRLIGSRISGVQTGNITLSVEENEFGESNTLIVYPNPVQDLLYIDEPGAERFEIINKLGEVCISENLDQPFIKVDELDPGIYIILIYRKAEVFASRFVRL